MSLVRRIAVPLVLVVVVAAAVVTFVLTRSDGKELTAYFPRSISLYAGSDVRVLGVPVGTVDSVTPEGTQVKVVMHYDSDVKLPVDAKAVIIAPAIVGDRYIQLTPAYAGRGAVLADNTVLQTDRTAQPVELDQVYSSLDRLSVALGPNGANKTGALNDLLQVTARNFGGEGAQFHTTIKNFAKLSTTLNDNKDALFGSARKLQRFITKLANNDQTVRDFNSSLAQISTVLAGNRQALAAALRNLGGALGQVSRFVEDNKAVLTRNISGLNRVAKVLVKERTSFDKTLHTAPLALNNLGLAYNPQAGTLDVNGNVGMNVSQLLSDPKALLCGLISANDSDGSGCKLIEGLPLPRTAPLGAGSGSFVGHRTDLSLNGLVGGVS